MDNFELAGKVVFITGAAGGIGAATARELYLQGANLALTDLHEEPLLVLAQEFQAERVLVIPLNVTDMAASRAAVAATVARFGRLDVVFANAGIAWDPPRTVATVSDEEFERIIEVNLLGVWRTVKAALPQIIENQGQVLITSSIYAFVNGVLNAPYALSKAGVESFARSLRAELAGTGASASVLLPGWIKTPIADVAFNSNATVAEFISHVFPAPLRIVVTPELVANKVAQGLRRRAPRIIVPGRWTPVFLIRGLINWFSDRAFDRRPKLQTYVREVEALSKTRQ